MTINSNNLVFDTINMQVNICLYLFLHNELHRFVLHVNVRSCWGRKCRLNQFVVDDVFRFSLCVCVSGPGSALLAPTADPQLLITTYQLITCVAPSWLWSISVDDSYFYKLSEANLFYVHIKLYFFNCTWMLHRDDDDDDGCLHWYLKYKHLFFGTFLLCFWCFHTASPELNTRRSGVGTNTWNYVINELKVDNNWTHWCIFNIFWTTMEKSGFDTHIKILFTWFGLKNDTSVKV